MLRWWRLWQKWWQWSKTHLKGSLQFISRPQKLNDHAKAKISDRPSAVSLSSAASPSVEQTTLDNAALQRDILAGRPFSLAEAIGREGGDFLKGISPVPPLAQAIATVERFIDQHLLDSSGALKATLQRWATTDVRLSQQLHWQSLSAGELALVALHQIISELLNNPPLFYEFVRQVDMCWGQIYGEPPHFKVPGKPPHPDDEYAHASVHQALLDCLAHLTEKISVNSEKQ
ncbi:MAG: hypothetical protein AAFW84_01965 [Cyanobacteria bacterium J06635_15]